MEDMRGREAGRAEYAVELPEPQEKEDEKKGLTMKDGDCHITCRKLRNVTEQRDAFKAKYHMGLRCERFGCGCGMFLGAFAFFVGMVIARLMQ